MLLPHIFCKIPHTFRYSNICDEWLHLHKHINKNKNCFIEVGKKYSLALLVLRFSCFPSEYFSALPIIALVKSLLSLVSSPIYC